MASHSISIALQTDKPITGLNLAHRTVSARLKVYVCLESSCCPPYVRGRLWPGRLPAQSQDWRQEMMHRQML